MWSVGVILYIMLVGTPPFYEKDDKKLLALIAGSGQVTFEAKAWKSRSIGSIDLLKKLMNVNIQQRINADQAMEHEWLKSVGNFTIEKSEVKKCLINFCNFRYIGSL